MSSQDSNKAGSALLLTLLIVSLMLMIVLSFTVYVRMELRTVQNKIDLFRAQKNAKLALALAINQLQTYSGSDQRITARAEIFGATTHPQNRYLTGVWDTTNLTASPQWLVSHDPVSNPIDLTTARGGSKMVPMLAEGTLGSSTNTSQHIEAEALSVQTATSSGSYAWWIADEGVKASLSLSNSHSNEPEIDNLHRTEMDRMHFAVPPRSEQAFAFSTPLDFQTPALIELTKRALNLEHYILGVPGEDPRTTGGYHDFTHNAEGLLTNPVTGGIKKDLSLAPSLLGPGFEAYMDYQSYLVQPSSSHPIIQSEDDLRRAHFITPPNTFTPATDEIVHSVVPVITDFGMQFSPRRKSSSDGEASLMMSVFLELWNPYTTALEQEDLILEITGHQEFLTEVRDVTDTVIWSNTFNPVDVFGETISIRLGREQLHTTINLEDGSYDHHLHGPGRLLYWTGLDDDHPDTGSFANRRPSQSRLSGEVTPALNFPTGSGSNLAVGYQMEESTLTIRLRQAPENGGALLAEYEGFEYDLVDIADHGTLSSWTTRWLTYRFRMIERGTTVLSDPSAWLKYVDRRSPTPSFGDDITSDTHTMIEESLSYSPGDSTLKNTLSTDQDESQFFFDRVLSSSDYSKDTRRDLPFFELPRQPLLSIGQLQHLYIHGRPPYSIGNSWGGEIWNELFDTYFLSGVQSGISEPDFSTSDFPHLPHPRYTWAQPQDLPMGVFTSTTLSSLGEDAGLAMKIKGAFNINSTSVDAWKAVLGGSSFANFTHIDRDEDLHDDTQQYAEIDEDQDYPAGFTRFPQSLQGLFDVDIQSIDSRDEDRPVLQIKPAISFLYNRTGATGTDTDFASGDHSIVTNVAEAIVEGIQTHTQTQGHPYPDLHTFLTEPYQSGQTLLEYVLTQQGLQKRYSPNHPSSDPDGLINAEERTPGSISQADIISALAPFLTVRSDTFTVRAFGETLDANGNPLTQVWCEAVVQRIITPVEPGLTIAEMADPLSLSFGRKFKIISFKWLTESEI